MSTPIATAMTLPFGDFVGGMIALGASGGGFFAFIRWLLSLATTRVTEREKRVDDTSDRLFDNAMGFTKALEDWAHGLQAEVASVKEESRQTREALAECQRHHADCTEQLANIRAQLGIKGVIAQEAQKALAADRLAERDRSAP